mgnify:CR=1 FL=1
MALICSCPICWSLLQLEAVNAHPRMRNLYLASYFVWANNGGTVFNTFSYMYAPDSRSRLLSFDTSLY